WEPRHRDSNRPDVAHPATRPPGMKSANLTAYAQSRFGRDRFWVLAATNFYDFPLVAQLAPRQLDEQVLEIRRPVQIADARARREVGEQRLCIRRVAKRCFSRKLEAVRKPPSMNGRPRLRVVAVDLDDFRFNVRCDERARRV